MNVELTRRALMRSIAGSYGSFFAPQFVSRLASAAERVPDRYFVFAYFSGGWDLLLGLDPRDPSEFADDNAAQTGIQPGYSLLAPFRHNTRPLPIVGNRLLGPAAGDLALPEVAQEISIFRGVNMSTLSHEVGMRYFLTGLVPAGLTARGSSIAAEVAAQLGENRPVPNLAHTVETYAEGLPPYAGAVRINQLSDLSLALSPSPTALPAAVEAALAAKAKAPAACAPEALDARGLVSAYRGSQRSAEGMVASQVARAFDFAGSSTEAAALRKQFGLSGYFDGPGGQAALALQAIRAGVSQVVSVVLASGLDTHFQDWASAHSPRLRQGFDALAQLILGLKNSPHPLGGNYLDKTVVVAYSEFGRTPLLNERQGRDHFLGNCCLVAGGGMAKGKIFGESSNYALAPREVNLTTGKPGTNNRILAPEHVLATVMASAKLKHDFLRVDPVADALVR